MALLLLLYYLRRIANFCSSALRQAIVWGFKKKKKKKVILHLEMMHFSQFYKAVLNIVTGIFISLTMVIWVLQKERYPDSWVHPEILPGYALFDLI